MRDGERHRQRDIHIKRVMERDTEVEERRDTQIERMGETHTSGRDTSVGETRGRDLVIKSRQTCQEM